MGKIAFGEILDKRGNVRERIRVDSFPATAGRSYANAVIVDDRQVSPEHLRLSLDGEGAIFVEDLSTENGTRLSKSREPIERHMIPAGGEAILRIGQTSLRIRGDDFAVGPATSSRPLLGAFGRYAESAAFAFVAFAAGFGINVVAFAQGINKKVIWFDLTGMSLAFLISFGCGLAFGLSSVESLPTHFVLGLMSGYRAWLPLFSFLFSPRRIILSSCSRCLWRQEWPVMRASP